MQRNLQKLILKHNRFLMRNKLTQHIKTVSQFHQVLGLPKPEHPLVSVINLDTISFLPRKENLSLFIDFYLIFFKKTLSGSAKFKYGQNPFDFEEGMLGFMAPNQVCTIEVNEGVNYKGWTLLVHPDFLWNTSLAKTIKHYDFFDYSVNEALHLSEKEEIILTNILKFIEQEYHTNIDKFSDTVIVSQLELLLNYSERFYHRQFLTRKKANHQILNRLENLLTAYFDSSDLVEKGVPTVQLVAETLNVSPNYLSSLLKVLTGRSTQQHIQDKLIEKAKEKLSSTNLTVSEIAYELGFEFPQSFSHLFKSKVKLSPLEFRARFN